LALVGRVHHHELVDVHGFPAGVLADAQRIERAERIRAELDAGADLAEALRLLEDLHREAAAREREGCREPADAAARDEDGSLGVGVRHGWKGSGRSRDYRSSIGETCADWGFRREGRRV